MISLKHRLYVPLIMTTVGAINLYAALKSNDDTLATILAALGTISTLFGFAYAVAANGAHRGRKKFERQFKKGVEQARRENAVRLSNIVDMAYDPLTGRYRRQH